MSQMLVLLCLFLLAVPASAGELTPASVADPKGDGPDGKGNTADDTWQFWLSLADSPSKYVRFSRHTTTVNKDGIPKKVRGPIASALPNPEDSVGWIFHTDWDGRFEGIWADNKTKCVMAHPYAEKVQHLAVAITYTIPADGNYDISGGVTDLQSKEGKPFDGIEWRVELASGGDAGMKVGSGGPVGDGDGRPDSETFNFKNVAAKKGQLVRLVIHPRKQWGTDLTRIDSFVIVPSK